MFSTPTKLGVLTLFWVLALPHAAAAQEVRLDRLERDLAEVQRQLAALKSDPTLHASDAKYAELRQRLAAQPRTRLDRGTLVVTSADGAFSMALHSVIQFDAAYFAQGRNPAGVDFNSGSNFRRAQIGVGGTAWRDWSYNFTYNFGGSGTEKNGYLYRAYLEYDGWKPLGFRVGAFSPYDSIEDATGGANLAFLERPTAVTIARNIGGASGREGAEIFAQGADYLLSLAYTGGKTTEPATFDEQQALVARAAWLAVNRGGVKWLLNADTTRVLKVADARPGPSVNVFSFDADAEISVDGSKTLSTGAIDARQVGEFGFETAANFGRLFGQGGWFHYEIERAGALPSPSFHGWYAMAAWSLTGETRPYDPVTASFHGLVPAAPLGKNGFGAWEVAARYSAMNLDYRPGVASALGGVDGGVQDVWTLGLNWYPNPTIRFMLDYDNIRVRHIAPGRDIAADAVALRSQIAF